MSNNQNPFRKRSVPQSTINELQERGRKRGLIWNAQKFPWIEITSLCNKCEMGIAGNAVLSSLRGDDYEPGKIRPKPTVQSLEVKKQGELGTTRRATVKITAYSDEQLVELQKCFFVPQMGVRVEWGWSIGATLGYTGELAPVLSKDGTVDNREWSDAHAICKMNEQEAINPNYCGLQGIVANFSYNLTTDNYWDCSIEVIAAAEAVSGAKVITYNCGCKRENTVDDENGGKEKVDKVESDLVAHLRDLQEKWDENIAGSYRSYFQTYMNGSTCVIARRQLKNMKQRSEDGGQATTGWARGFSEFFTGKYSYETYISWNTFEAMVNAFVMDLEKQPGDPQKWLGRLRSNDILLTWHPAVQSSDPRVCFIPGGEFGGNSDNDIAPPYNGGDAGDFPFAALETAGVGTSTGVKVKLGEMMINVIFLLGELRAVGQGDGSLMSFLNAVLKKISDVCGNLWSLEVVSSTECCEEPSKDNPPTLTVIDLKQYEAENEFVISMLPTNSYVRDFKFEMTMTDAMKTQAVYSGGPIAAIDSPSGGNCDGQAFKAFNNAAQGRWNLAKYGKLGPQRVVASDDCVGNKGSVQSTKTLSYDTVFKAITGAEKGISGPRVDACRTKLSEAYSLTAGQFPAWKVIGGSVTSAGGGNRAHCQGVPLPFNFSFTVDGVGGFKFGQMVTSDRMPKVITDKFHWQITTVEHSVTVQDWTTTVNTVCRYKGES